MTATVNALRRTNVFNLLAAQDMSGSPVNGTSTDVGANSEGTVLVVVNHFITGGTLSGKCQSAAAPAGPWTDVPGGDFPNTGSIGTQSLALDRSAVQKYVRYVAGGDPTGVLAVIAVAFKKAG